MPEIKYVEVEAVVLFKVTTIEGMAAASGRVEDKLQQILGIDSMGAYPTAHITSSTIKSIEARRAHV